MERTIKNAKKKKAQGQVHMQWDISKEDLAAYPQRLHGKMIHLQCALLQICNKSNGSGSFPKGDVQD